MKAPEYANATISEIGTVLTGRTPPNNDPAYFGGETNFLTPTDMGELRKISKTARTLSEFGVQKLARCLVPKGIGVSCIGWQMGKSIMIDSPTVTNQQINSIVVDEEKADRLFVYYALSARRKEIFALGAGGSRTPILNKSDFEKLCIKLPPLPMQRSIAKLLGKLDDKIELNRGISETLAAMTQAVFKDWFVDFGPARRKAAGETNPVAILGGLLPDPAKATPLAALFPDRFGANGLPEGWEEHPLDQIAEFLNGLALQKYPAKPGEDSMPVIKIAELRNGVTSKSNRASRTVPEKYVLKDGDYIFSWSGSLMAKYWTEGEGALNQHLFKVTSETHPMWVVSNWVEHHLAEFQRIAAAKAVTMGHIKRSHLSEAMCVLPRHDDIAPMGKVIQPILDLMIQNEIENQTLAAIRDHFLPKLMSGEIRLKDAEDVV